MLETPKWSIGDILVSEEEDETFMVFIVLGYDSGAPLVEPIAVCDTLEKAELVGGLLKAYANAGHSIPSGFDSMHKN